ncbi:hypothetical protein C8J56DRAFT_1169714 [Mycena floridula]|nr:hypothetical protein C8J56DRAFT_1169714 [Mycena floridula]
MSRTALFRAAKAGDARSIQRIAMFCRRETDLFSKLIPVLFHHIQKPVPDIPMSSAEAKHIIARLIDPRSPVMASINALDEGLERHHDVPEVRAQWIPLRQWLVFFFEQIIQPAALDVARNVLALTCRIMANISKPVNLLEQDLLLPGYSALLIHIWIYAADSKLSREVQEVSDLYPTIAMVALNPNDFEVIEAMQDTSNSIDILLGELKVPHIRGQNHPLLPIISIISGLHRKAQYLTAHHKEERDSLRQRFQARNAKTIPDIVSVIGEMISIQNVGGIDKVFYRCLLLFLGYFSYALSARYEGPMFVAQVMDARFFDHLAKTFPYFISDASVMSEGDSKTNSRGTYVKMYRAIALSLRFNF